MGSLESLVQEAQKARDHPASLLVLQDLSVFKLKTGKLILSTAIQVNSFSLGKREREAQRTVPAPRGSFFQN